MIKVVLLTLSLYTKPDSVLNIKLIDSIQQPCDLITSDVLSNLYLINGSSITKYNAVGDSLFTQNFNTIRNIEFFDASQALKIYAVNFSFNTLLILDNTLSSQNNPINFDRIPVDQVSLLCASNFNNTIWIFDGINMKLNKTDQNFRIINSSVNFYSNRDLTGIPNYMTENDNFLYLNIPGKGIKVFNQNCNFNKSIPIEIEKKFVVKNNKIYYLKNKNLYFYSILDFETGLVPVNIDNIDDFSIEKNRLFIMKNDKVYFFEVKI